MIRGLGDPLVGTYARVYLIRTGFHVLPYDVKDYLLNNYADFLFVCTQIKAAHVQDHLTDLALTTTVRRGDRWHAARVRCETPVKLP